MNKHIHVCVCVGNGVGKIEARGSISELQNLKSLISYVKPSKMSFINYFLLIKVNII